MADLPANQRAAAANEKPAPDEPSVTLSQIKIFIIVCVAGAIGTIISKILTLDADVARYSWGQSFIAGAAAAAIMVYYLARTDTRNVIYACCFALLCGMVGPAVLQKAVKDIKGSLEAGDQVKKDAAAATAAINTPPTTTEDVKAAESQAAQVIASTQKAVEKDAPQADVQTGKDAVGNIVDKLQQTVDLPNTPPATKVKAAEALGRISQSAQQANLPRVALRAEQVQRSPPIVSALVDKLPTADQLTLRSIQTQLADIGQPAVKPLITEVNNGRGRSSPAEDNVRLAAAGALSKMKQPIVLSPEEVRTVVSLLSVPDAQTRLAAAEFLMNLEDEPTIHSAFSELRTIARKPANPDDKMEANLVYNTGIILGTWARNLKAEIKAPADAGGPGTTMARAALDETKQLDQLLRKQGVNKWKHTIADLEDLIKKAEPRL